jgi:hypothetical protein
MAGQLVWRAKRGQNEALAVGQEVVPRAVPVHHRELDPRNFGSVSATYTIRLSK